MNDPRSKPNVFEYLDAHKFLSDLYLFRKSTEIGFSFEAWAQELKFRSRSYLRMAVLGKKNVSAELVRRVSSAESFTDIQQKYFESLARYSQAPTKQEKEMFGKALVAILRTVERREPLADSIEFLSNPLHARLLVLLGFNDIKPTLGTFARLMELDAAVVQKALSLLLSLGLAKQVEVDGEIHFIATKKNFDIPDKIGSESIMRFHEMSLQDAISAFHKPSDLRRYRSLILPLSAEERESFNQALEEFVATQLSRFKADSLADRRLYQINLNISVISNSLESSDELKLLR